VAAVRRRAVTVLGFRVVGGDRLPPAIDEVGGGRGVAVRSTVGGGAAVRWGTTSVVGGRRATGRAGGGGLPEQGRSRGVEANRGGEPKKDKAGIEEGRRSASSGDRVRGHMGP
jgi:hypothetical protein